MPMMPRCLPVLALCLLLLSGCRAPLEAPTAEMPAPPPAATATTQPERSATPPPARPTPTPSPTATLPSVPTTLERGDLAVISPANLPQLRLLAAFKPGPERAVVQPGSFNDRYRVFFGLDTPPEGSQTSVVYVWNLESGLPDPILTATGPRLSALALSPAEDSLLAAGQGLAAWESTTWSSLQNTLGPVELSAALFDPAGTDVYYALAQSGEVGRWSPASPEPLWQESVHDLGVTALAVSPDGGKLASAGLDGRLLLLDPNGEVDRELSETAGQLSALAFNASGSDLYALDRAGQLSVWRMGDGRQMAQFPVCSSGLPGCPRPAFSPDRRTVALADPAAPGGAAVIFYSLPDGKQAFRLMPGADFPVTRVQSLGFSADGRLLLLGSQDGRIAVWGIPGSLFAVNARLQVVADGEGANFRDRPSVFGSIRTQLAEGDILTLAEGPVIRGGFNWWRALLEDGREGWIVEIPEWVQPAP